MQGQDLLLAIDTSSRQAGIALLAASRGLLAEYNWHSANRHTAELVPALDLVLGSAGVSPRDLTAVGVAIGPGSFSGLRVGLSAAKGLALARGIPLVGVPTLDVTAFPHQAGGIPVVAVVQAGRGRVYFAQYESPQPGCLRKTPAALGTVAGIAEATRVPTLFAGELSEADRAFLVDRLGVETALLPSPSLSLRRAGYLAELAWRRCAEGLVDDPATLSPLYLQQPEGAKPGGLPGASAGGARL